jgi:hypothetical protein
MTQFFYVPDYPGKNNDHGRTNENKQNLYAQPSHKPESLPNLKVLVLLPDTVLKPARLTPTSGSLLARCQNTGTIWKSGNTKLWRTTF